MFDWNFTVKLFGTLFIFFIPYILFVGVIGYLKKKYLPKKYYEYKSKMISIEDEIKEKWKKEDSKIPFREVVSTSPEYINAMTKKNKFFKLKEFFYLHFYEETTRNSWFYTIFMYWPSIIAIIVGSFLTTAAFIDIPTDIYRVKHWDTIVTKYETMEHPTFTNCQDAEKTNYKLDCSFFIKEEYRDSLKKIDTEELWSRFYSNIKVYTDTLEGSLLKLADAENKLANTLDKFKK